MRARSSRLGSLALVGAALVACGGGGTAAPPAPPAAAALVALTTPLAAVAGTPFTVSGIAFPGQAGDPALVRFVAADGLPLSTTCTPLLEVAAQRVDAGRLIGVLPAIVLLRAVDVRVEVTFADATVLASSGPLGRLVGTPDAALDQDLDGVPDACDPKTYAFEGEPLGARPAHVPAIDGDLGLRVVAREGEQAAAYDGSAGGNVAYDRLSRVEADAPLQDTTVYLDTDATAGSLDLELWSEGSYAGVSGGGLIVQMLASGQTFVYERAANAILTQVAGPVRPPDGRLRLRLRKGTGTTSTLAFDALVGGAWTPSGADLAIADDRAYRGLSTSLCNYYGGTRGVKRVTVVHEVPPAVLTLARAPGRSMDWTVFQRDAGGRAVVPLRLLYRLAGGGWAEVRVVRSATGEVLPGHDFADHVFPLAARVAGRADLEVPAVPTGGNYDVQVRLRDPGGTVRAQEALLDVAVGDVWLAAGQSNTSGYAGTVLGAEEPIPQAHLFHNDGTWRQGREPMDDGVGQVDLVSREFPQASFLLAFAKRLWEGTGVPVGVVPASLGGTNLYAQWQRTPALPEARQTLYGSLLHRARLAVPTGQPVGLLWFQGESDALALRTTAQYRADLAGLLSGLRADLGAPGLLALVGQLGTYDAADLARWLEIQEAQRQGAESDPLAGLATAVDLPRADGIHFSVAGYRTLGARFAVEAQRLRFGATQGAAPRLTAVSASVGASAIVLTYDGVVTGGAPALFAATDAQGALAIDAVTAIGTQVTLTLARPLAGGATLRYGLSVSPTAAWLKRLSDAAPAACFAALPLTP